jgi:hypothetical protein
MSGRRSPIARLSARTAKTLSLTQHPGSAPTSRGSALRRPFAPLVTLNGRRTDPESSEDEGQRRPLVRFLLHHFAALANFSHRRGELGDPTLTRKNAVQARDVSGWSKHHR